MKIFPKMGVYLSLLVTFIALISIIIVPQIIIIDAQQPNAFASANAIQPSPHLAIYSEYSNSHEILSVPVNSSGLDIYPNWTIFLYGSGSYTLSMNGSILQTGYSHNSQITYAFSVPGNTHIKATLRYQGINYTFNDTIIGPVSTHILQSVSLSTSCHNQNQYLTASPGQSGVLLYPHWNITMKSSLNSTYKIYLGGSLQYSGVFSGAKSKNLTIPGNTTSVTVQIGNHVYKYPNELIARVPIKKYYAPRPPPLVFTAAQYEEGLVKAFIASFFAILISFLGVRKWILEQRKREVMVI